MAACFADYRCAMCGSFVQGVLSATLADDANEAEQNLAQVIRQRFVAAAQRLKLLDLMFR